MDLSLVKEGGIGVRVACSGGVAWGGGGVMSWPVLMAMTNPPFSLPSLVETRQTMLDGWCQSGLCNHMPDQPTGGRSSQVHSTELVLYCTVLKGFRTAEGQGQIQARPSDSLGLLVHCGYSALSCVCGSKAKKEGRVPRSLSSPGSSPKSLE